MARYDSPDTATFEGAEPATAEVPVDASENGATSDANAEAPAKVTKPKTTAMIGVNVPIDMKAILDKTAEDAGKTPAAWLRDLLAQTVNYTLPIKIAKGRASNKYVGMTDEQKAEAQKAENTVKRQTASALLAALEAGDLNVDLAEILAKYKPATRAPKADKAAEAVPAAEAVS